MEQFFAIALRGGLGFILGLVFGIGGLILALAVVPGLVPPVWTLVVLAGAGSGVAAFFSWFKPEANWKVKTIGLGPRKELPHHNGNPAHQARAGGDRFLRRRRARAVCFWPPK